MDFSQAYNRATWLNFLEDSFLPDDFRSTEEPIGYSGNFTKMVTKLGECSSLQLAIFEIKHSSVNDARVGLSKEAFALVRNHTKYNRALALFVPQNTNDTYRFSYVEFTPTVDDAGKVKRNYINPRRYSYILGKSAKIKTPQQYLQKKEIVKDAVELKNRFSVEVLTKEFYDRLSIWYEWAKTLAEFPNGKGGEQARKTKKDNDLHLIRLITRLIFVWFMRQSKLIPEWVFDENELHSILADFSPNSKKKGSYYNGILQNLFFATLNREILNAKGKPNRQFTEHDGEAVNSDYAISYKYRDNKGKSFFKESHAKVIDRFEEVPFLNGGLFECLDSYVADGKDKKHGTKYYRDGFSREEKRRAFVPDCLFWGDTEGNDGIINILSRYNFTIEENTPSDIEVALDPELLGKVFENLLGYFNPETHEMARKSSGSFYTPREIVNYMVDESLSTHIKTKITALSEEDIHNLFSEDFTDFTNNESIASNKTNICICLKEIKILDPACGSGAFPMGILNRMIDLLQKLEGAKTRKQIYELKLHLIENCIYGIDIQTIAVQIAKLRFFISLVCEQERNNKIEENYGIKPLPNLETKFVAANTLLGLPADSVDTLDMKDDTLNEIKNILWDIRKKHFYAKDSDTKKQLQRDDEQKRDEIRAYLIKKGSKPDEERIARLNQAIADLQQKRLAVAHENFVDEAETQSDFDFGINKPPKNLFQIDKNKSKRDAIDREIKRLMAEKTKEENRGKNLIDFDDAIKNLAYWNPYDQNEASPFFDSVWMFGIDKGFDIVIGNPPYVQLQNNHGELANKYQNCNFETFTRTGDIYQLFYEKGINLLCYDGILCYITSNKWMRAGYGEETRKYFSENVQTLQLVDFAGQKVFESATVDVSITVIRKNNTPRKTIACTIKEKSLLNLTDYVRQCATHIQFPSVDSWVILNPIEQRIKEKIEKVGIPLKDWDISINYGIKTGCNEAFIIDKNKRDELIKKDANSAEIIRPILRGRDIKHYGYEFADLYLIFIPWHFPLHMDSSIMGASKEAEQIFKKEYPAVYNHLHQYKDILSARNTAETGIRYEWYALQRWGANYWEDFSKQKIVWARLMRISKNNTDDFPRFALATKDIFVVDSLCFFTGRDIQYFQGILNSELAMYYFLNNIAILDDGGIQMRQQYIELMPIPRVDETTKLKIIEIVKLLNKKNGEKMDNELNNIIYALYGFDQLEINQIKSIIQEKLAIIMD